MAFFSKEGSAQAGSSLGKKFGPLPAWAWLGAFAGAAYLYQHRKGAGPATPVSTGPPPASSYYSTISNVNYNQGPRPATSSPPRPPGSSTTGGHARGPLPPQPVPPGPPSDGGGGQRVPPYVPERPGGGPDGVQVPDVGAVAAVLRLPAQALAFVRGNGGGAASGAVAGQRATSQRVSVRPALRAAQAATEQAPGLVGLEALKEAPAERGRSTMPPAPALRQRPAPPRVMDHEAQRNVKLQVVAGRG